VGLLDLFGVDCWNFRLFCELDFGLLMACVCLLVFEELCEFVMGC